MLLVILVLFYTLLIDAIRERHYLQYRIMGLSKATTEFTAFGVCNDRQISHFSDEEKIWILTEEEQAKAPPEPPDSRDWFIYHLFTLSNCTKSQCSEIHIFQRIIGCEVEKLPNGTVNILTVFDEYGFDGEDYISFNSDTMQWIEKNPKADKTRMKWDQQTLRNKFLKNFLKSCVDWISTFVIRNKRQPNVHFTARQDPADRYKLDLSCLATSFYPRDIEMYIRKKHYDNYKGIDPEDQESSEIRPNGDGSFQMRKSVKIERNHKEHYKCVVSHSSLESRITVDWDGRCIDCDYIEFYIGGAAAAVVLLVVSSLVGWCIHRKRKFAMVPQNQSDGGDSSYG